MVARTLTAAQFKGFLEAIADLVRSVDTLVETLREEKGLPPSPTPTPPAAPATPKPVSGVKYDELAAAVIKVAEVKGQSAAVAILKQFGATHAKQLPEDKYGEALKAFQDALAAP